MGKKDFKWQRELDIAKEALFSEPGKIELATDQYVAFRYIETDVRLVFYPHRTSAGNYHLRIRIEPCRNYERAEMLACRLDEAAGCNCTFQRKHSPLDNRKQPKPNYSSAE